MRKQDKQVRWTSLEKRITHELVCDVHSYLQTDEGTRPSWCEMDGWSWSGARRSKERGRRGPDVPCLMPVDHTGRDTVAHLVLLWKEPITLQAAQYILRLCMPFWVPSLHWLQLCLCLSKHQEEVRVIWVEWQIMTSLCLAFDKYLLGTRCAKQYSLSFHK